MRAKELAFKLAEEAEVAEVEGVLVMALEAAIKATVRAMPEPVPSALAGREQVTVLIFIPGQGYVWITVSDIKDQQVAQQEEKQKIAPSPTLKLSRSPPPRQRNRHCKCRPLHHQGRRPYCMRT